MKQGKTDMWLEMCSENCKQAVSECAGGFQGLFSQAKQELFGW